MKILIGLCLLISISSKAQTYGGEIRAKNNSWVVDVIHRNGDALKVSDSAVAAKLAAGIAVTGTFWQATQPVSGTVTVGTFPDNEPINISQINGVTPLMGAGNTGTGSLRVTVVSDQAAIPVTGTFWQATQPVSGTVTINSIPAGTNNIGDVDVLTVPADPFGANADAASATGSISAKLRFIASTGIPITGSVAVTGTFWQATQPVSGTVSINAIPAGTNNIGDIDVLTVPADPFGVNADAASATGSISAKLRFIAATGIPVTSLPSVTVGTFPDNEPFNVSQINGVTPLMGQGATGTGSLRVTIANDNSPIDVVLVPDVAGGASTFHLVSAASTNATNIKASAGQLYGYYIFNANAAARKVAFHNTSGTPTAGSSVFFSLVIPAGSGANVDFGGGIAFSSGIGITTTTGTADSDATAVASGDLIINLFYK